MKKAAFVALIMAYGIFSSARATVMLGGFDTEIVSEAEILAQGSISVGDLTVDPIIAYSRLDDSSYATEYNWMMGVADYLGIADVATIGVEKIDFATDAEAAAFWNPLGGDVYSGSLPVDDASHFMLKLGGGQLAYDTFLYENRDSLREATISLGWLEGYSGFTGNRFDLYRISHVSNPVPEPTFAGLLLLGLVGLGLARRAGGSASKGLSIEETKACP